MKDDNLRMYLIAITSLGIMWGCSSAFAAEKRCTAGGEKVECPTQTDAQVQQAAKAFEKETDDYGKGKGGSAYGIAPFDYLTGVGKKASSEKGGFTDTKTGKTDSGYGTTGSLRTELWDRVKNPTPGAGVYDQWVNNWSPKFGETLVAGADPIQGKTYYYSYCIACHGWTMHGDGPNAVDLNPRPRTLTRGAYMQKKTNLELFNVIKGGGESVSLSSSMPTWGNVLLDQDIWNVIAFIRAMQDVPPPKSVEDYLHPKSTFKPIKGDVDALNASKSKDFKEMQELVESDMPGRAPGSELTGGGFVEGGNRINASDVVLKVK
ncbi:MAG: cytochrome c [Gallionella sp.]|nr:cytochrome c [Gallionella sp.]